MRRSAVVLVLLLLVLPATFAEAPRQGRIRLGRVEGTASGGHGTTFSGEGDMQPAKPGLYRNVILAFPEAHIVVRADAMIFPEGATEFTLSGKVRVTLDTASPLH